MLRDRLNGSNYHDVLKSFSTLEEKLIFEMRNGAMNSILDMLAILGTGLAQVAARIEELGWDFALQVRGKLARYLFSEKYMLISVVQLCLVMACV